MTTDPTDTRRLPALLRALGHRNYRLFAGGQIISLCGTWMQMIAQSWLVYRLTGSATLLGLVGFAGRFPVFVFATLGGTAADRWDRRRIIIATQTASMVLALVFAALTLTEVIRVWHIFALSILLGIVNALDIPVRQAFVIDMVGREDILNAIAINSSIFNGARIIGPAIAGVIVASVGEGWCFMINGLSYIAVIAGLIMMRLEPVIRARVSGSALAHIIEGFRYAVTTRPVRALLLLLGLVSFMGMPYTVLMPIFADRILGGGANALGLLMGAAGFGALAGAVLLASREGVRGLGRMVAISSAGFGISLALFAMSRSLWLSIALLVPVGLFMMIEMAASNTFIQTVVPDELRGRVMAVYSMMFMGMAPLGAIFAGLLADRAGAPITVALGGLACLAGSAFFTWRLPKLRIEAGHMIVAVQSGAGEPAEAMTGREGVVEGPGG